MIYRSLPTPSKVCLRLAKPSAQVALSSQRHNQAKFMLNGIRKAGTRPLASMENRWWEMSTVAVVTGANKGIGYEIARLLAEAGMSVVVTSRSEDLGKAALDKLKQLPSTGDSELHYHQLDISSSSSIASFADWLRQQHGKLDILINNAGIAYKGNVFGADEAATTIATNFLGTRAVCDALEPLLTKPGGRIVNVTSGAGLLRNIPSGHLRDKFDNCKTVDELVALGEKFVLDIRAGRHEQEGWPNSMYGVSKCLENSYTRVLAEQMKDSGVMVYACSPGYCATDMSSWRGTKSAAAGADTPVWLALTPQEELKTGKFYKERSEASFT